MGWISKALMIGGAIGAPFTGGASLALTAAGASMEGAEKAAKQEEQANNQALALQKQMYEQHRQDMAPWANTGASAMYQLGSAMGLPAGGGPIGGGGLGPLEQAAPTAREPQLPAWYDESKSPFYNVGRRKIDPVANYLKPGEPGIWKRLTVGQMTPHEQQNAAAEQTSSSLGSTVRMRDPDGEESDVPADMASYFEAKGAQRVA